MLTVRRLYQFFQPEHYALRLKLEREQRQFSGTVTIHGEKVVDEEPIRLHAKDLTISSVVVEDTVTTFTQEADELVLTAAFPRGSYAITVTFSGTITDAMHGLYPCYFEHDGIKKEVLATQFESHHTREVFPCIDEPEAKATFDVTLVTEPNMTVLSNMPIRSEQQLNDNSETVFETTPRMSTYLLAFVVGELHAETARSKRGVVVSAWATVAQPKETLRYALDTSLRLLEYFEDYFGVPFPLPKLDHVALPDFDAGAMENWGLITYREIALLIDPEHSTLENRQYVASVISHELSHQWFGNLVTMRWWNDLWLNESFARLMEYIPLNALEPAWNVWNEFTATVSSGALARDALDGVQAVQTDVNHPDEISTLFDPHIVYSKGARLVRMLHDFVGDTAFREGLQRYFKKHAYSNTSAQDLWDAMTEASGHDVSKMMQAWIAKPGYPVVTITNDTLTQQRFFIGRHKAGMTLWPIVLHSDTQNIAFDSPTFTYAFSKPTLLNGADATHAIVQYPEEWYARFLSDQHLTPQTAMRLLSEQVLLARSGLSSASRTAQLVSHYSDQTNSAVWQCVVHACSLLQHIVGDGNQTLKQFVGTIAAKQYARLGWTAGDTEPINDRLLRPHILSLMGYAEHADVIAEATGRFTNEHFTSLSPDTRAIVAGICIAEGPQQEEVFEKLRSLYMSTHSAEVQQDLMFALSMTKRPRHAERLVSDIQSGTIRPQNVRSFIRLLMANRFTRETTWQWMRSEWDWIQQTFGGDMSYSDYPTTAGKTLRTERDLHEYRAFFNPKRDEPALTRAIELGDIQLEATTQSIHRDKAALLKTLEHLTQ